MFAYTKLEKNDGLGLKNDGWLRRETGLSPSVKYFTDRSEAVPLLWIIYVISVFRARPFIDALWSPAGKGLNFWLSFVMSNCKVITFPLVSWVRCGD